MDENKLERKLRRKARKLARWMRRNGIDYAHIFVFAPNDDDPRWYADAAVYVGDERVANVSDFYEEGEL